MDDSNPYAPPETLEPSKPFQEGSPRRSVWRYVGWNSLMFALGVWAFAVAERLIQYLTFLAASEHMDDAGSGALLPMFLMFEAVCWFVGSLTFSIAFAGWLWIRVRCSSHPLGDRVWVPFVCGVAYMAAWLGIAWLFPVPPPIVRLSLMFGSPALFAEICFLWQRRLTQRETPT